MSIEDARVGRDFREGGNSAKGPGSYFSCKGEDHRRVRF